MRRLIRAFVACERRAEFWRLEGVLWRYERKLKIPLAYPTGVWYNMRHQKTC